MTFSMGHVTVEILNDEHLIMLQLMLKGVNIQDILREHIDKEIMEAINVCS